MLLRYCGDRRVMSVSGTAPGSEAPLRHSYRFSDYHLMWVVPRGGGPDQRSTNVRLEGRTQVAPLSDRRRETEGSRFAGDLLDRNDSGDLDFWDLAWNLSCWLSSGVAIHPARNLVRTSDSALTRRLSSTNEIHALHVGPNRWNSRSHIPLTFTSTNGSIATSTVTGWRWPVVVSRTVSCGNRQLASWRASEEWRAVDPISSGTVLRLSRTTIDSTSARRSGRGGIVPYRT